MVINMFRTLIALTVLAGSGCSDMSDKNSILGVYKVIERKCGGTETETAACNEITLLEFVNGNFYKIGGAETAFVIWSGGSELSYNARKYEGNTTFESYPARVTISAGAGFADEYVVFKSNAVAVYVFPSNNRKDRSELVVAPISKEELRSYSKEYPGNE